MADHRAPLRRRQRRAGGDRRRWRDHAARLRPHGRIVQRRAAAPSQPEQTETFAYNANGQLPEAINEHARLQWFYDAAGNLVRERQHYQEPFYPDGKTVPMEAKRDELDVSKAWIPCNPGSGRHSSLCVSP